LGTRRFSAVATKSTFIPFSIHGIPGVPRPFRMGGFMLSFQFKENVGFWLPRHLVVVKGKFPPKHIKYPLNPGKKR